MFVQVRGEDQLICTRARSRLANLRSTVSGPPTTAIAERDCTANFSASVQSPSMLSTGGGIKIGCRRISLKCRWSAAYEADQYPNAQSLAEAVLAADPLAKRPGAPSCASAVQ